MNSIFQIIPSDIEFFVASLFSVKQTGVIAVPHTDPKKGQMVAIFIALKTLYKETTEQENQTKKELIDTIKEKLNWQQIKGVYFLDDFPYLPSFKIDKLTLIKNFLK